MQDDLPPPPHDELPPISRTDLKALFDVLDRPNPDPCTHTFKETAEFLEDRNLPVEETILWLRENGAGCDCEAIFNTEAEWGNGLVEFSMRMIVEFGCECGVTFNHRMSSFLQ